MLLGRSNDVHGKCEHRKCNSLPEVVVLPKITIVVVEGRVSLSLEGIFSGAGNGVRIIDER